MIKAGAVKPASQQPKTIGEGMGVPRPARMTLRLVLQRLVPDEIQASARRIVRFARAQMIGFPPVTAIVAPET